jgi:hypothetical protein
MSVKKTVFAGNEHNQYNVGTIVKEVTEFYGQSVRTFDTNSVIPGYFTHFRATYDANSNPSQVSYYRGSEPYLTKISFTSPPNNSYFVIHSAPDNERFLVWFNVDGAGVAPVSPYRLIQINIASSDSPEIIAAITKITIENLYSQYFTINARNGAELEIATNGLGVVDPSADISTGSTITGTPGAQELVGEITIRYIESDPVFNGQLLKGYTFDLYSGKFVLGSKSSSSSLSGYVTQNVYTAPDGTVYEGTINGAKYLISRITQVGQEIEVLYANASNNAETTYDTAWDNNEGLTYVSITNLTGI